jgi:PAS domain S-box-containing protein
MHPRALSKLVDGLGDAVFVVAKPDRKITYANASAYDMFGYEPGQLIGLTTDVLHADAQSFQEFHEISSAALERAPHFRMEFKMRRANGEVFPTQHLVSLFEDDNGEGYAVSLVRDITYLKQHEEDLLHASKMDALGRLTGGIAHDFNNMLTVIIGNMEMITEQFESDSPAAELSVQVLDAAGRARDLTSRLLTFARQQSVRREKLDLNRIIERLKALLARTLGAHIEIGLQLSDDLWSVQADRSQVESGLLNLAVNARDAMPAGGRITVQTDNVNLACDDPDRPACLEPGDYTRILFSDTGRGIDKDILDQIFDPFFTTKQPGEGTGMGLSMTFAIFREHGGHVDVESRPGKGTTFRVLLPRDLKPAESDATPNTVKAETSGRETILVVEDEPMVRSLLIVQLQRLGYRVLQACDGTEALETLAREPGIDLLLTDVIMPGGLNGPQLLVEARRDRPDIKVVFCSGYGAEDAIRQAALPSDIPVLAKPFSRGELADAVSKALEE